MKLDVKFKGGLNSFIGRQEYGSLDNMSNIVKSSCKILQKLSFFLDSYE